MTAKKKASKPAPKSRPAKSSPARKARRRPVPWRPLILLSLITATLAVGVLWVYYYTRFTRLVDARLELHPPATSAVYSRNGKLISSLYGDGREKQRPVRFGELPQHLVNALLAAEDAEFFSHGGLDLSGMMRALYVNITRMEKAQGGSTLTQQFIKNYFLTPEKSLRRKFEEIFLAVLVENRFSKEEIFELYANQVYLGQVGSFAVVGFGQASQTYLGKGVRHINLPEAALLAGLIQAPNRYSPQRNLDQAVKRRNHVLGLMHRKKLIDDRQLEQALQTVPQIRRAAGLEAQEAPYFVDFVRRELDADWNQSDSGYQSLEVRTTLDAGLQQAAYRALQKGLSRVDGLIKKRSPKGQAQAALVALDPRDGHIRALIGGRRYAQSQYNRAVQALRQPGSTFKPFVYAAALRRKVYAPGNSYYTLSRRLLDVPYTFTFDGKQYSPANHSDRYRKEVSLRNALVLSLNVPTVKLAEEIGFESVTQLCRQLGIQRRLEPYPSIALGTFELSLLDLARGYAVFANQGRRAPVRSVASVKRDGSPLPSPPHRPTQVLEPEVAFLINSALGSVLSYGTGKSVRRRDFWLPAAGKTGSAGDAWFVGYTPDLVCAVWVGFDDSQPLGLEGSQAALPIWIDFMKAARDQGALSGAKFPRPSSILSLTIDRQTGQPATPRCPDTYEEYYIRGTEPLSYCAAHGLRSGTRWPARR
ncbi:MAG: transglycosylase domain-containing protein [Acidobacteriota bacterium]